MFMEHFHASSRIIGQSPMWSENRINSPDGHQIRMISAMEFHGSPGFADLRDVPHPGDHFLVSE